MHALFSRHFRLLQFLIRKTNHNNTSLARAKIRQDQVPSLTHGDSSETNLKKRVIRRHNTAMRVATHHRNKR